MRKSNTFGVISKDGCIFCDNAKKAIHHNGDGYTELNIDTLSPELRKAVIALLRGNNISTLPAIFYDGMLVGGFTQLELFYQESSL